MPVAEAPLAVTPGLPVLYRDADFVAVAKPAGLLVHRTRLSRSREAALQIVRDQLGQRIYPVHRLDRATSGVLVFGLSSEAAGSLAALMRRREVGKRYLAVVRGWPEPAGVIEQPLRAAAGAEPRPACTRYRRLATVELPVPVSRYPTSRYALVALQPVTGRRHQIRRHLSATSHPVIGDTTHGDGRHNRLFRERFGVHRLLLHAAAMEFRHPVSGRPVVIRAEPPRELADLLAALGWQDALSAADTAG